MTDEEIDIDTAKIAEIVQSEILKQAEQTSYFKTKLFRERDASLQISQMIAQEYIRSGFFLGVGNAMRNSLKIIDPHPYFVDQAYNDVQDSLLLKLNDYAENSPTYIKVQEAVENVKHRAVLHSEEFIREDLDGLNILEKFKYLEKLSLERPKDLDERDYYSRAVFNIQKEIEEEIELIKTTAARFPTLDVSTWYDETDPQEDSALEQSDSQATYESGLTAKEYFDFDRVKKHLKEDVYGESGLEYLINIKAEYLQKNQNDLPPVMPGQRSFDQLCDAEITRVREWIALGDLPGGVPRNTEQMMMKERQKGGFGWEEIILPENSVKNENKKNEDAKYIEPRNQKQVYFALRILLSSSNRTDSDKAQVMSFLSGYSADFYKKARSKKREWNDAQKDLESAIEYVKKIGLTPRMQQEISVIKEELNKEFR